MIHPAARWSEGSLLVIAGAVAIAAGLAVSLGSAGTAAPLDLAPALALAAMAFGVHVTMVIRGTRCDPLVLPIATCLMGLSLALMQRLAPDMAARQWAWLAIGLVAVAVTLHAPYDLSALRRYRYTAAAIGLVLVGLTLVAGRALTPGGPRLWLGLGPMVFQPSELLKLLLVVFLAGYLDDKRELLAGASTRLGPLRLPPLPYLAPFAVMLGVALLLVAVQGDLGAALLLFAIGLAMLFLASGRVSYVAVGLALFVAGAWFLHGRMGLIQARVSIWLDPWRDPQGLGYQLVQSLMAMAAGGATGTGLAEGMPTVIPAVHTDFVFAAVAEEMGLAGAGALLGLYLLLGLRGYRIAVTAPDAHLALLAAGLTVALTVQTLVIVGGVLKLIPLTGITLPLMSYGGSSILMSAVAVGLLLRIDARERG